MECSEVLCESQAEVYCECETPAVIYCSQHGYEHFKATSHEMHDFKPQKLDLNFSSTDYSLAIKKPLSISDILAGPSFFQRSLLKYLKQKTKYELDRIGITGGVRAYLFEYKMKNFCFLCEGKVSLLKLHLAKEHGLSEEEQRKEYWNMYGSRYLEKGIIMSDIV